VSSAFIVCAHELTHLRDELSRKVSVVGSVGAV
jgi:hypothetical protein